MLATWDLGSHLGEVYVTAAEVDAGGGEVRPVLRFELDRVICLTTENNHYRQKCKDFLVFAVQLPKQHVFLSFFL